MHTRGRKPSEAHGWAVRRATCTHWATRMRASRLGIVLMVYDDRRPVHAAAAHRGAAILAARAPDSRTAAAAAENLFRAVLVGSPRCGRRTTRRWYPRSLSTKAARASRAPRHPRGAGPRAHAQDLCILILKYARPGASTDPALAASAQNEFWSRPGPSQSLHNRHTVRSGARVVFVIFFLCPLPNHHNIILSTRLSLWIENILYLRIYIR